MVDVSEVNWATSTQAAGSGAFICAFCACAICSNIWHSRSYSKKTGTASTITLVATVHTECPPSHQAVEMSFVKRPFTFLTFGVFKISSILDTAFPMSAATRDRVRRIGGKVW
eukprot:CAMPEP_0180445200 /NCGR_PEP_ID=MMETSP1036_2-20121128/15572_1 /TAXON_ID=632150 /ORGANISM="Azadinium spinosum, Strain 3D9" /LENGTH=112 /DNA_ID=CAMNT_0022451545 /DNA_START=118 /DNA_END=453 /DNA_ORIENTATION=-